MTSLQNYLHSMSCRTYTQRLMYLITQTGRHPSEIKKKTVKTFLTDLHINAHHIYVLLENLPLRQFSIDRYHRHGDKTCYRDFEEPTDPYTLANFYNNYDRFHEKDYFRISFRSDRFYFKLELSVPIFTPYYEDYLAYHCERRIHNNDPIVLTPELCNQYNLTQADTNTVNRHIEQYTKEIVEKLQLKYDYLKRINCIIK